MVSIRKPRADALKRPCGECGIAVWVAPESVDLSVRKGGLPFFCRECMLFGPEPVIMLRDPQHEAAKLNYFGPEELAIRTELMDKIIRVANSMKN